VNKEQEIKLKKAIIKMLPPTYSYAKCSNIHCKHESSFKRTVDSFNWVFTKDCPICGTPWEVKEVSDGNYDG
jgi:transcription elongation factor Elf1